MNRMFAKTLFLQFLGIFAVLCSVVACSDKHTAGTVTDTGNTVAEVTGVVHRADGKLASNAVVRMARVVVDDSLIVPEMLESVTDTDGVFAFDSAIADTFQLAIIDTSAEEIFYMPRTTAEAGNFDSIKLEKAAFFSSVLYYENVAELEVAVGSHFIVYLTGTPFYQSVFAGDSFSVMIPQGTWWMEFFPGDPQIVAKLQSSGVADSLIYRSWKMTSEVKPGDTLDVRPFLWSTAADVDTLVKETEEAAKDVSRLYGKVACKNGKPCEGVEVALITDLYGFTFMEGDSLEFDVLTKTDSLGRWWLNLPKEVPEDSFRVEFRKVQDDIVVQAGTSRYVKKSEIAKLKDTLDVGVDTLQRPASLLSGVRLVVDSQDTTQSSNCMVNSVVVGIKGTSHFIRDVSCDMLTLTGIPAGIQEIVLYSGDPKVISVLEKSDAVRWSYVTLTGVDLPENAEQKVQWITYTPPSKNILE
ncbi:MAG: carboxypeptidase regulatory-like domain-containing protein [Fibrobacter sp.]|nr:carboxypeptidase regulatory-like domain-containing protein [Fibrobacter sp.]